MINQTEQEEREWLEVIKEKLILSIRRLDESVRQHVEELRQSKEYIYEHQSGMDEADMVSAGQSIDRMAFTGESAEIRKRRLLKLSSSPYFARIDFTPTTGKRNAIYIGIYTFIEDHSRSSLIYDWRSPVASMFYDFELGEAWYQTPNKKITGELLLKRQYKITDGQMEFMLENSLNITDEVLQKELSKSADDKMKTIVATIQRDQNAIIRNENSSVLIIQGVAGSGKTSIALHRIAFLLYRYRDSISAKDVLIISPNKVFADYISNVLPELGEEHIPEMGMEELAREVLENKIQFQSFFQQVSSLLDKHDESFIERIRFKSSFEFLSQLNKYLIHAENSFFNASPLRVAGVVVPGPLIQERFKAYQRMPMLKRIPEVIREIVQHVRNEAKRKLMGHEKSKIWEAIPRMYRVGNVAELYADFYKWINRQDLFRLHGGVYEYADVFPLIYCKIRLEGVDGYERVKHLLVDEMQDYTPVQYAVLSRLFSCRKTILGDVRQTVNPYSASSEEIMEQVFPQADIIKLNRSYRSTAEINAFAQKISFNPQLIVLERHGDPPVVIGFETNAEELKTIKERVVNFMSSGYHSMGIICKTRQQAKYVSEALADIKDVHLLTPESTVYKEGIIVTTVHLSKGLEFDEVIIPFASAKNYHTEVDKNMLYIACTRAMHQLTVTFTQERSRFIV